MLPHVKITDLLMEVDRWTGLTRHFTHLKTNESPKDTPLLLTAILADATNLGLRKMAESCPGTSLAKLSWLVAWHIRDEAYSKALAAVVNHQHRVPFATNWGEGTTSSSDGQRYRAGGRGQAAGQVNLKYGNDPGVTFYTHVSDQYAPFHTKVINAAVRDATHVLDGLLCSLQRYLAYLFDRYLALQDDYPGTDVLINLKNIRDKKELERFETGSAQLRSIAAEKLTGPFDISRLNATHQTLFGKVYEWAGKFRENTGTMTKGREGQLCTHLMAFRTT